jgi:regulator of replication initiation timing
LKFSKKGNKKAVTENKALKVDLEKVSNELKLARIEKKDSAKKFERLIGVLKDNLKKTKKYKLKWK